jgi:hypothetical protein
MSETAIAAPPSGPDWESIFEYLDSLTVVQLFVLIQVIRTRYGLGLQD